MLRVMTLIMALSFLLVACSDSVSKPTYVFKPAQDGLAAKMGDLSITNEELMDGIEAEVYEAETKVFDVKFNKLKGMIMQKLVEKDPRKKGLSNDEFMDKYISAGVKISEKDIDAFIKEQNIPQEHINPQVREKVKHYLEMEKKKAAVEKWMAEQTKKNNIEVFIPRPRRPTTNVEAGDAPFMGDKDAKVTIVEFSDFQCPFCAKGAEMMTQIKKKYGNKVKIAFKNFPLSFHNQAEGAAVAGLCANEQGTEKFWKMHDAMFADQFKLDKEGLKGMAKTIGLKIDQFEKCLEENKYLAQVKADVEYGLKVKVKSTPTFFVNGQLVNGAQPIEVFSEIIDEELAR